MSGDSVAPVIVGSRVQEMFGSIASRYDLTNSVLSFGIHHLWRRALLSQLPRMKEGTALDLCTGTGDLIPGLSKRFGSVVGADFCKPMLDHGREKLRKALGAEPNLVEADAMALPFQDASFDAITVAFGVRNFEDLDKGLQEMHRVLKPGGVVAILEFGQPSGIIFPALYRWYSNVLMPRIGGFLTGNREAYTYLPKTSSAFPCGVGFLDRLKASKFKSVSFHPLTGGIAYVYRAEKGAS